MRAGGEGEGGEGREGGSEGEREGERERGGEEKRERQHNNIKTSLYPRVMFQGMSIMGARTLRGTTNESA